MIAAPGETPLAHIIARLRVLVVEDENIVAKDIEQTLKAAGYTVCGLASEGLQAVRMAQDMRPDLVLMDIRLHGAMDGVEAARQIRERFNVPVVFLTAYADQATLARAAAAEPYGYVLKPFDEKELQITLLMAVCKHRAFAELDTRVRQRTEEIVRTEAKYRKIAGVAQLGVYALETRDTEAVIKRAIGLVAETLGTELVNLLETTPDGVALVLRAGTGWNPGVVGTAAVGAERESQGGYTLLAAEPVIVEDLGSETRFTPCALLREHAVVSGLSVVIHAPGHDGRPYGVLGAHTRAGRSFSEIDVHFLQAVANVIAAALMRRTTEEQLRAADRVASERARLAEAERAARSAAESANQAKDEFLAMLAHELRNPLGAIRSAVAVLDRIGTHDDTSTRAREVIGRQVDHLARVVDDLLDVSRVITGKIALDRRPVDLAQVAEVYVATLESAGRLERHAVRVHATPAWVDGDAVRMEQVVANLLLNALKYTPAGGRIEVTVVAEGGDAVLRIEDSGVGIPPELVPRIFDLFVQGERTIDRAQGGLGIGLTLVRRLVELHGGTVEVSSAGAGAGSAFTVRLPVTKAARVERRTAPSADGGPRRILVIEDNRDAREMLRQLLELHGHDVRAAEDGQTGLDVAVHWKPDVALVDLGLPIVDGYEVCRRLRSSDGGRRTRVVAITGYAQPEDHQRTTAAGFDAHLVKPVKPHLLLDLIARLG